MRRSRRWVWAAVDHHVHAPRAHSVGDDAKRERCRRDVQPDALARGGDMMLAQPWIEPVPGSSGDLPGGGTGLEVLRHDRRRHDAVGPRGGSSNSTVSDDGGGRAPAGLEADAATLNPAAPGALPPLGRLIATPAAAASRFQESRRRKKSVNRERDYKRSLGLRSAGATRVLQPSALTDNVGPRGAPVASAAVTDPASGRPQRRQRELGYAVGPDLSWLSSWTKRAQRFVFGCGRDCDACCWD